MARPIHRRTIESIPEYSCFHTEGIPSGDDVILYTDEFEVIRLIDKVHLSQEEAAKEMGVSRATIASIYQRARDKIALLIVDGRSLSIGGGAFVLKETNKGNKNNVIADKGEKSKKIVIEDDGCGIDEKIIEDIYEDKCDSSKVGLYNVYSRIKLIYGTRLEIERLERGTKISFEI